MKMSLFCLYLSVFVTYIFQCFIVSIDHLEVSGNQLKSTEGSEHSSLLLENIQTDKAQANVENK